MMTMDVFAKARRVLELEAQAILDLSAHLDDAFLQVVDLILRCRGRVVLTGMGKSGHIAGKIAATLASTGTPAFFLHPAEAAHGDLGMTTSEDVVLAMSNSGESAEILALLPSLKRKGVPIVALSGRADSTLAREADYFIFAGAKTEACPHNLAPTSSTTASLALGDALAIVLLEARGFQPEDFALSHPGGALGRRLLIRVQDLMHQNQALPIVAPQTSLRDTLLEISRKGLGLAAILDGEQLCGIFTDGDLRRALDKNIALDTPIAEVMTRAPRTILPQKLATEAVRKMESEKILSLLVCDENGHFVGVLTMHDVLRAGVI